jgi:hypothetical protein
MAFHIKPNKRLPLEGRTTLDNLHQRQIGDMLEEKKNLSKLEDTIVAVQKEIEGSADIITRSKKEEELNNLLKKKDGLTTDSDLYDYFFNTGQLLYTYYELQDKINNGGPPPARRVKAKPGSVLAALGDPDLGGQGQGQGERAQDVNWTKGQGAKGQGAKGQGAKGHDAKGQEAEGRDVLLEKYLHKVDPEHARAIQCVSEDPNGICENCDLEMKFSNIEALFFCEKCGYQEFVLIDSDKPSYKDPPREVTYYAYKRINHFNEWLAQFQAKESTEIPEEIFQAIVEELKKERISNIEEIKPGKIREILKKLKCTNFYEHVPYILNRINGKNAPVMSREVEEKLRFMFKEIQSSFIKHCPKTRSNFLSYSYVLYKFCELLELDDYLQSFPLLKNRDKLYNQDKIWERICADLRWQFIRSI